MSLFMIVGSKEPLYSLDVKPRKDETAHVDEFVLHSALDIVQETMWSNPSMWLKVVDKFNEQFVSGFVTATNIKFILLHESRNEDAIKSFFLDVYDLYVKLLLNPFYTHDTPISSIDFDSRVRSLAKRL
ncbi:trafficking protein particle complex subunit 2 [Thraustotheca clavata]|uniref:Trafficking protein particle complex subunit 2 n=1 Tax=Thraustotheca clavata TaxID=74557 RepID=A0A1V9ZY99_9STRA|nr:trafficking protein particle complex subunit 2 [Thraustotheca clavata]